MALSSVYFASKHNSIEPDSRNRENNPKTLTIIAIIATVLFWASAFPAIRVALNAYTPTEVAFLRYLIASVVLILYAAVHKVFLLQFLHGCRLICYYPKILQGRSCFVTKCSQLIFCSSLMVLEKLLPGYVR